MRWDRSLSRDFEQLEAQENAHSRGRQFEILLQRIFEVSHFHVVRNPAAARPRQTDLFAAYGNEKYLIEAKWKTAKANIDDVSSLRDRLQRTAGDVIGVFFSMSGFTQTAMDDVECHRDRPILLFEEDEIGRLFDGRQSLPSLLRRKRDSLVTDGRVLLGPEVSLWQGKPLPDRGLLSDADVKILALEGSSEIPWIESAGAFGKFVFTQELPDINWTPAQGTGVGFDLSLPLWERDELRYVMEILRGVGWISSSGRWCIQQSDTCWHGAGARGLLEPLDSRQKRYERAGRHIHHTEEVSYFDVCDGGFYTLSAGVVANEEGRLIDPHLSVQLAGIPLHPEPFNQLVGAFDLDDQAYFRPLGSDAEISDINLAAQRATLEPVALLVSARDPDGEEWVVGIVAKNPFWRGEKPLTRVQTRNDWPEALSVSGVIICDLRSWHELARKVDSYHLWKVETVPTAQAIVLRVVADWASAELDDEAITLPIDIVGRWFSGGR